MKYSKIKKFVSFLNEANEINITMLTGIPKYKWDSVWKNKNLIDKLTNVTSDVDFAFDYSYNFDTGKYDDVCVEISNIPIDAFISYRYDDYEDDDDFHNMVEMTNSEKYTIINNMSLFLVDLFPYKKIINTKLLKK